MVTALNARVGQVVYLGEQLEAGVILAPYDPAKRQINWKSVCNIFGNASYTGNPT